MQENQQNLYLLYEFSGLFHAQKCVCGLDFRPFEPFEINPELQFLTTLTFGQQTDQACSTAPGPAGWGLVNKKSTHKDISEFVSIPRTRAGADVSKLQFHDPGVGSRRLDGSHSQAVIGQRRVGRRERDRAIGQRQSDVLSHLQRSRAGATGQWHRRLDKQLHVRRALPHLDLIFLLTSLHLTHSRMTQAWVAATLFTWFISYHNCLNQLGLLLLQALLLKLTTCNIEVTHIFFHRPRPGTPGANRKADATTDLRETFVVPALVCCRPSSQRGLPGRHVHNFRVRTVTIPHMNFLSLIFQP